MTLEEVTKPNVIERAELKEKLVSEIVEVTFTKVNGDTRVMNCTLLETIVPKSTAEPKEDATPRKVNEELVVVWDVDAKGWRSFHIKNITGVSSHVV
jgi:hypothetical protein